MGKNERIIWGVGTLSELKPRIKKVAKISNTVIFDDVFGYEKVDVSVAADKFKSYIENMVKENSEGMLKPYDPSMTKVSFNMAIVGYNADEYVPEITIWFQRYETDEEVQQRVKVREKAREERKLKKERAELAKLEKEKALYQKLKNKFEDIA